MQPLRHFLVSLSAVREATGPDPGDCHTLALEYSGSEMVLTGISSSVKVEVKQKVFLSAERNDFDMESGL